MALDRETLLDYLANQMGLETDTIEDDTLLFSSSILDSFSLVDVMMFLEKKTGTKIEPTEVTLDNFDSIARILRFINNRP